MFCSKCGTQNGPGENFCIKCGAMLEINSPHAGGFTPTSPPLPPPAYAPPPPPAYAPPPPPAYAPPLSPPTYTPPPPPPTYAPSPPPTYAPPAPPAYVPPPAQPASQLPQSDPQYPGTNQFGQAPSPQYNQQPPYGQLPPGQPPNTGNFGGVTLQSNAIFTDSFAAIKKLFSAKPENSVITSMQSGAHTWVIHGAIYVLSVALLMVFLTRYVDDMGWLFGTSLIIAVTHLFCMMGGIKLMYVIFNLNVPFVKIMNLVASATLFYSLMSLVALLISFFSISAGALVAIYLLVLLGFIYCIAMLLSGMKRAVDGQVSMFWTSFTFAFSYAVSYAIAFAIIDFDRLVRAMTDMLLFL